MFAMEEIAEAEQQEMDKKKKQKMGNDREKAEDIRLKLWKRCLTHAKGNQEDNQSKQPCRSGGDAISYLSQRADANYALKKEELRVKKDQQGFEKKQMEIASNAQKAFQEQQSQMLKVVVQQQQSQQTLLVMPQQQQ